MIRILIIHMKSHIYALPVVSVRVKGLIPPDTQAKILIDYPPRGVYYWVWF